MKFYDPNTTHLDQLDRIADAYRLAGQTPPSRAGEVVGMVEELPTVEAVAWTLAREALTTRPDPAKWLDGALEQIRHAQAADQLRAAFHQALPGVEQEQMPALVDAAAKALAKGVDKTAKALTKAAANLPHGDDPFDLEAIVDADASVAMKQTQDALRDLSTYAGVHRHPGRPGDMTAALARLLPILELPESAVEILPAGRFGNDLTALNRGELAGTRTIRRLDRTADRLGVDRALIGVARGEFTGVTIKLADTAAIAERRANGARAFERRVETQQDRRPAAVQL